MASSDHGEKAACLFVGPSWTRGLSSPVFRTVTGVGPSGSSLLLEVTCTRDPSPPSCLGISPSWGPPGWFLWRVPGQACMESKSQRFHLERRGQSGLCFCTKSLPAELPEKAGGLWEPHMRGPSAASLSTVLQGLPAQPADVGACRMPCSPVGGEAPASPHPHPASPGADDFCSRCDFLERI